MSHLEVFKQIFGNYYCEYDSLDYKHGQFMFSKKYNVTITEIVRRIGIYLYECRYFECHTPSFKIKLYEKISMYDNYESIDFSKLLFPDNERSVYDYKYCVNIDRSNNISLPTDIIVVNMFVYYPNKISYVTISFIIKLKYFNLLFDDICKHIPIASLSLHSLTHINDYNLDLSKILIKAYNINNNKLLLKTGTKYMHLLDTNKITKLDTHEITSLHSSFYNLEKLKTYKISNEHLENIINNSTSLTSLSISNYNTNTGDELLTIVFKSTILIKLDIGLESVSQTLFFDLLNNNSCITNLSFFVTNFHNSIDTTLIFPIQNTVLQKLDIRLRNFAIDDKYVDALKYYINNSSINYLCVEGSYLDNKKISTKLKLYQLFENYPNNKLLQNVIPVTKNKKILGYVPNIKKYNITLLDLVL